MLPMSATTLPATEPFPRKLVEKIQAGQIVEMKELLSDNIALLQQLDVFQGQCAMYAGAIWCTEATSLRGSNTTFVALQLLGLCGLKVTRPCHTRQGRLVLREAQRHGGAGWLDYDRVFCQQAAIDTTLPWNSIHPAIQAATLTSRAGYSAHCAENRTTLPGTAF